MRKIFQFYLNKDRCPKCFTPYKIKFVRLFNKSLENESLNTKTKIFAIDRQKEIFYVRESNSTIDVSKNKEISNLMLSCQKCMKHKFIVVERSKTR